eukprot:m.153012 g.153012  ORF g.153012 m.153012 type:complete len:53 (+) comp16365_c0_seq9:1260-1418(+)
MAVADSQYAQSVDLESLQELMVENADGQQTSFGSFFAGREANTIIVFVRHFL